MYKNIVDTLFAQILKQKKSKRVFTIRTSVRNLLYVFHSNVHIYIKITQPLKDSHPQLSLSPKTMYSMILLFAAFDRIILKQPFLNDHLVNT